eukprot:4111698-Karenia_brevis.AAC.1
MGADAVASAKQGRCTITAIAIAKGIRWDPWIMGPVNAIMHALGIINAWEEDVSIAWIKPLWDVHHASNPWAGIKGPMGAAQLHLGEKQWK